MLFARAAAPGIAETSRFYNDCGAPIVVSCASCGAPNPPGSKFCASCGATLAPRPAPTTAPPPHSTTGAERRRLSVIFCELVGSTVEGSQENRTVLAPTHNPPTVRFRCFPAWKQAAGMTAGKAVYPTQSRARRPRRQVGRARCSCRHYPIWAANQSRAGPADWSNMSV
jgi:hypothetical protein